MGNGPRITTRIVQKTERLHDWVREAMADGRICKVRDAEAEELSEKAYALAQETDEGVRVSVALMRNGFGSENARRYGFDPSTVEESFDPAA